MTKRRLCVFFCSPYYDTSLISDDIARLYEIVNDDDCAPFDLLLETSGGETDAAEGITAMLRKINRDFRVIVPSRAKSNGTVICLASHSIVMGVTSELGPIEPFLRGTPVSILSMSEYKNIDFSLHQAAHFALKQTSKLATDLLISGMLSGKVDKDKIVKDIVDKLCTRDLFHSHGSVINCDAAENLGLNIVNLPQSDEVWKRYWLLHNMYCYDSHTRGIGKFFEGRTLSKSILGNDPQASNGSET